MCITYSVTSNNTCYTTVTVCQCHQPPDHCNGYSNTTTTTTTTTMEARLRALKVVDLKNILARAQLALPPKANKPDLISKILDSQLALDVYEELHGSGNTPRPASTPQPPSANTTTATAKKIAQNDVDVDRTQADEQAEQDSAEKTDLVSSTSTRSFSRTHTCIQKNNTSWPLQKSTLPSFLISPFPQTYTNHSFDWSTSAVPAVTSTNSSLALGADISASASAPVAAEPSTAAVPATDTNIETASETPTVTAAAAEEEEDEETKKRRARAARFGIPFVEKPKPKPQQQQKREERQAAKKEKNGVAAVAAGAGTGTGKRDEKTKMQIEEVRFLFLFFPLLLFYLLHFFFSSL